MAWMRTSLRLHANSLPENVQTAHTMCNTALLTCDRNRKPQSGSANPLLTTANSRLYSANRGTEGVTKGTLTAISGIYFKQTLPPPKAP